MLTRGTDYLNLDKLEISEKMIWIDKIRTRRT